MMFKIETPAEFFEHIAAVDVMEFLHTEPNLRAAYHACTSLLSYRDWVLATYKGSTWSSGGVSKPALRGITKFQEELARINTNFDVVTDLANASKHMVLDSSRSRTTLYGNADTFVEEVGSSIGEAAIAEVPVAGSVRYINVKIGDQFHDVRSTVHVVFEEWKMLNSENSW
jgi:hypothetical protein